MNSGTKHEFCILFNRFFVKDFARKSIFVLIFIKNGGDKTQKDSEQNFYLPLHDFSKSEHKNVINIHREMHKN